MHDHVRVDRWCRLGGVSVLFFLFLFFFSLFRLTHFYIYHLFLSSPPKPGRNNLLWGCVGVPCFRNLSCVCNRHSLLLAFSSFGFLPPLLAPSRPALLPRCSRACTLSATS